MQITVKLMGVLKEKMPPQGTLQLDEGATIQDALAALEIDDAGVAAFTVNGDLERDRARRLADGDEFTVLPPVGGG